MSKRFSSFASTVQHSGYITQEEEFSLLRELFDKMCIGLKLHFHEDAFQLLRMLYIIILINKIFRSA